MERMEESDMAFQSPGIAADVNLENPGSLASLGHSTGISLSLRNM